MFLTSTLQPRDYQLKVSSSACNSNTLVILPTGLGKTVVAALVADSRFERHPDGRILMLAPTRPLTLQHCNSFRTLFTFPANHFATLTGVLKPDDRTAVWKGPKMIFATPQAVLNDVKAGRATLKEFVLAVFDEAHRCVRDYPYTEIARLYTSQADNPLILGLTASPGGSKARVEEVTKNLFISKVEARDESDEDVKPYVQETMIEWVKVRLPDCFKRTSQELKTLYAEKVEKLQSTGLLPKDRISKKILLNSRTSIIERLNRAEKGGNARGYLYGLLINQAQAVMILHALELIETQTASALYKYLCRLRENPEQGRAAKAMLSDERWILIEKDVKSLQSSVEHPKVEKLESIVSEQLNKNTGSRIIVFAQYRDTIDTLLSKLSQRGFAAVKFVGHSDRMEDAGMDQKAQSETLEKFKNHIFNILVSSSIGEEGLHVPDVDLVVFYDAVPSEIRAIQRRGRTGRTMPGRVVILLAEETLDESYHFSSMHKEKEMKKIISQANRLKKTDEPTLLDFIN